jgi:hypothetical protein
MPRTKAPPPGYVTADWKGHGKMWEIYGNPLKSIDYLGNEYLIYGKYNYNPLTHTIIYVMEIYG